MLRERLLGMKVLNQILGIVLNGVAEHDVFAGGYYYGDYYGAING